MVENPGEVTKIPGEVTKLVTKTVTKLPREVTKTHLQVLKALAESTLTRSELMDIIGVTDQSANVSRHLTPLISAGLITMSNPSKPTSRDQRYHLTEKGKSYLVQHESDLDRFVQKPG